ncbi:MAG: sugar phosphate isomerase/epimerase [Candidatus Latescibacteria bacterium]|nr:sugar phosphate isomerase/epimerase [Candidatus Latescibacterota bacterium]
MKLAICNELFQNWPINDVFRRVAEIGYAGVELAPFTFAESVNDISPARRTAIRRQAEANGLEITGLHWLLVSPKGLYLNHPDEAIRSRTQQYLCDLIRFCCDVGGRVMVVGSPKQRNVQSGHTDEETWEVTKSVFEACLSVAAECGVTICIEPLDRQQTNFINTPAEAARMVRELNHPNFRMILDVRSTLCQGEDIVKAIHDVKAEMAYFHLNDASGHGPGFGHVDFGPILRALRDVGYTGYASIEVFDFSHGPEEIARRSFEYLRDTLAR